MCERCGPPPPEIIKAHDEFEAAMHKFLEACDLADGVVVDWVLVCSQNIVHDNGVSSTMTCWAPRMEQPTYRTKGLIHEVLDTSLASDISHRTVEHLTGE